MTYNGGVVLRGCRTAYCYAPAQHVATQYFAHWELLKQQSLREFGHSICNEERRGQPTEILSFHVEVLLQAHDICIIDHDFVQELQEETYEHQGHDMDVDLAGELGIRNDIGSACDKDNVPLVLDNLRVPHIVLQLWKVVWLVIHDCANRLYVSICNILLINEVRGLLLNI